MLECVLIAFISASSPTLPPPPTKEVVIEHLVGLPAKREEDEAVLLPAKKIKGKRERGDGNQNTICEQKFDNPRSYNRRGDRNH